MSFESLTLNEEAWAVKVSYGDDLRRATVNETAYVALRDLCAKLFELDPATIVLKYQDNEGDKITVSSDGEVREALQLAREKNILRLFVEVKAAVPPTPAPAPAPEEEVPAAGAPYGWRHFGGPMRGGFPHRGGFFPGQRGGWRDHGSFPFGPYPHGPHGGPPHHGPHGGPHAHGPHGGPHHGPHAHGPHGGPPHHGPHGGPHAHPEPNGHYTTTPVFGYGMFAPADAPFPPHRPSHGPYSRNFKEQKHAMKEQLKMMKANAKTQDDWDAIKDFKEQMHAECKLRWHEMKSEKKEWKAEKKAEKAQWKHEKKCNDRLVAKHVADVTIPDNSELPADTPVTKTWRIRNSGFQAWPADSQLIFVSHRGDNINGPERVFVGAAEPQQEVDVSVTFITPAAPGRYIGYYRMATADGVKFGQRVWVSFIIPAGAPAMDATIPLTAATPLAPVASPFAAPQAPLGSPFAAPSPQEHQTPTKDVSMD